MVIRPATAILGAALVAVACQPPNTPPAAEAAPRLKVSVLEIGRAVGSDKRVTEPADRFLPRDTVYASVVTKGDDKEAVLEARWSFEGGVVSDTTQRIAQDDSAVTEFHVFDPSGWKPGRYRVEIFLDGMSVGQREFTVDIPS